MLFGSSSGSGGGGGGTSAAAASDGAMGLTMNMDMGFGLMGMGIPALVLDDVDEGEWDQGDDDCMDVGDDRSASPAWGCGGRLPEFPRLGSFEDSGSTNSLSVPVDLRAVGETHAPSHPAVARLMVQRRSSLGLLEISPEALLRLQQQHERQQQQQRQQDEAEERARQQWASHTSGGFGGDHQHQQQNQQHHFHHQPQQLFVSDTTSHRRASDLSSCGTVSARSSFDRGESTYMLLDGNNDDDAVIVPRVQHHHDDDEDHEDSDNLTHRRTRSGGSLDREDARNDTSPGQRQGQEEDDDNGDDNGDDEEIENGPSALPQFATARLGAGVRRNSELVTESMLAQLQLHHLQQRRGSTLLTETTLAQLQHCNSGAGVAGDGLMLDRFSARIEQDSMEGVEDASSCAKPAHHHDAHGSPSHALFPPVSQMQHTPLRQGSGVATATAARRLCLNEWSSAQSHQQQQQQQQQHGVDEQLQQLEQQQKQLEEQQRQLQQQIQQSQEHMHMQRQQHQQHQHQQQKRPKVQYQQHQPQPHRRSPQQALSPPTSAASSSGGSKTEFLDVLRSLLQTGHPCLAHFHEPGWFYVVEPVELAAIWQRCRNLPVTGADGKNGVYALFGYYVRKGKLASEKHKVGSRARNVYRFL